MPGGLCALHRGESHPKVTETEARPGLEPEPCGSRAHTSHHSATRTPSSTASTLSFQVSRMRLVVHLLEDLRDRQAVPAGHVSTHRPTHTCMLMLPLAARASLLSTCPGQQLWALELKGNPDFSKRGPCPSQSRPPRVAWKGPL